MRTLFSLCLAIALVAASSVFAQAPLGNGPNFLTCANYNDGPGSSDMTLIVQLEIDGKIVVDEGHDVTYVFMRSTDSALGESLGTDWTSPTFDDSAWDKGISGVGYSDGDDNTEVKRENASGQRDGLTIYTRYRFNVANAAAVKSVILRTDYDDQAAVWLNGEEIWRSGGAAGLDLTWDVFAGGAPNHGSTETPKNTPNHPYQEEITVDFYPVNSVAVEPTGKLATSWASIKANH